MSPNLCGTNNDIYLFNDVLKTFLSIAISALDILSRKINFGETAHQQTIYIMDEMFIVVAVVVVVVTDFLKSYFGNCLTNCTCRSTVILAV